MVPLRKKTDKIEVRLAPQVKATFLEYCRAKGHPASAVVRALIQSRLEPNHQPEDFQMRSKVLLPLGAAIAACLALLSAASCLAAASGGLRFGLTVFLAVQAGLYVLAAAAFVTRYRRWLIPTLIMQAVVQLVWTAEANPSVPAMNTALGLVVALAPTIVLAAMAGAAMTPSGRWIKPLGASA